MWYTQKIKKDLETQINSKDSKTLTFTDRDKDISDLSAKIKLIEGDLTAKSIELEQAKEYEASAIRELDFCNGEFTKSSQRITDLSETIEIKNKKITELNKKLKIDEKKSKIG